MDKPGKMKSPIYRHQPPNIPSEPTKPTIPFS